MKIYLLISFFFLFLLSCKHRQKTLYHIYTDEETAVNTFKAADVESLTDVSEISNDTSYFSIEEMPSYLEVDSNSRINVDISEAYDWNDTISDAVFVSDSTLQLDSAVLVQTINITDETELKNKVDSLNNFNKLDTVKIESELILPTDSLFAFNSAEDSIYINTSKNQDTVSETLNFNAFGSRVIDSVVPKTLNSKQLYLIDKDIYKSRLAYIEVDTIHPVFSIDSGRTIIVIRKLRSQLDQVSNFSKISKEELPKETESVKREQDSKVEKKYTLKYNVGSLLISNTEEMNEVIEEMNLRPELVAVISSKTDASGAQKLNMKLSKTRAEEVRDHLINNGISDKRVFVQFLGEKYASMPNNEEERETLILLK